MTEDSTLPKRTAGDYIHTLVKAGLSGVPLVGGSAAELFTLIIAPPLEKRRDDWLRDLADVVDGLRRKQPSLTPEELSKNDAFISAILQASQIAMRTHQDEKRRCLKNALVHVAMGQSEDNERTFFLAMVDSFTVTHIEILRLFRDRGDFSHARLRDLETNRDLSDPIVLDLNARGLLKDPRPFAARNRDSLHSLLVDSWSLSNLGSRFFAFISA